MELKNKTPLNNVIQKLSQINPYWILLAILAVGAILRFAGCDFGAPGKYRPDEEYLVSRALGFHGGNFNPKFFIYPSLYMYVLSAVLYIDKFFGELLGVFGQGGFHGYLHKTYYSHAHIVGRFVTACFGVVGIYATFLLGKRAYGRREGLLAAALLAINFLHSRDSHFATTDITMITLMTFALFLMIGVIRQSRTRDYFLTGMFIGLSISTKYAAFCLGFPFALAHILRLIREKRPPWDWRTLGDLLMGGVAVFLFFFLTSPYVFLDFKTVVQNFDFQKGYVKNGLPGIEMVYGWRWLIPFALHYSNGILLLLFGFFGTIWACTEAFRKNQERNYMGIIFLSFMIPMSIVLMRSKLLFLRYALPFIPIIVILAARLIGLTADKFIKRDWRLAFSVILLVIIGFDPAFRSIQNTILLTKKDTRTFAMEWIGQHIPAKTVIRVHGYPYARPELPRGYRYQEETLENLKAIEGEYWFLHHEYPIKFFSPPMKPSFVDYFNTIGEIVFEISPFTPGKEVKQGYDLSDAFYLPLSGFSNVERPGPIIRIYKVHSKPSDPL